MTSILPDATPMHTLPLPEQCCLLCGADARSAICTGCAADLPPLPAGCPQCAEATGSSTPCGRCLQTPPAFDHTLALFAYEFPLDRLLQQLKYQGQLIIARHFGEQLAARCRDIAFDTVVATPLHPAKLASRGFNQSLEIARPIASRLRRPLLVHACERVKATHAQADLPLKERPANVRNAFFSAQHFEGQHVLLVDDVMTTGATLDECAKVLKRQGAKRVTAAVVARALKHG